MSLGRPIGFSRQQEYRAVALSLGLASVVFLADLFTPLGVASAVPYTLALLLALNVKQRQYAISFAVLCSALTIIDLFTGPGRGGSELWKVLTNRSLALCMIWITLTLGLLRARADQRRHEAEELTRLHLADLAHMGRVEMAGQLAGTLAHELNQPFAAISLQAEIANRLLQHDDDTSPQLVAALDEVTSQSHRAAEIISSLRKLLRKAEPQRIPIQLNDVVSDVTRLMQAEFQRGNIRLRTRLNAALPDVLGDRIQLEQVLLNLLQNACDAVADTPHLRRRIVVETRDCGGDCVSVCVQDNGAGLAAADTDRLFERFYSSKPHGMGMGLAISRTIIEAHQGRLWAEANEDGGAIFNFSLPKERTPSCPQLTCLLEISH